MRVHPISMALRALRGERSLHGRPLPGTAEAADLLRRLTGQDFGQDAAAWGEWLRRNRWAYSPGIAARRSMFPDVATVAETGRGGRPAADHGWGAVLADGTRVRVYLTAKVRTTKTPVLEVGQMVHVVRSPWDPGRCSIDPGDLTFVSRSELARRAGAPPNPRAEPDRGG